jgi:acetyl-CoA acetyltransferase
VTAAIAGIGATEFSKRSGRSELRLTIEAITGALEDAGLSRADIDGLVTMSVDASSPADVARALGLPSLPFSGLAPYGGGGACAVLQLAVLAVTARAATTVVCYRGLNGRSSHRYGTGPGSSAAARDFAYYIPFGLVSAPGWIAMFARRYMHESGASSEDFGRVTVAERAYAAANPRAYFYRRPITIEDHQASRWIAEPLRLLDCCQETDGAVALIVTSLDRAAALRQRPAVVLACAQAAGPDQHAMTSYYRDSITAFPECGDVARQLWQQSGLRPDDVDVAELYEHFSPAVLFQLEAYGFCEPGEARHFINDGEISLTGRLPVNTHGGQLGEGYLHGMNGIAEAVRQVRGTAVNQVVKPAIIALATGGPAVPTSGALLGPPEAA